MSRAKNTTTAPTGSVAPFGLRMLPDLKEMLEAAARLAGRSMNAEVSARLRESFGYAAPTSPAVVATPQTTFRYRDNPVADQISYAIHLQWSLKVLHALCHELPAPDPRERVFVLGTINFESFSMRASEDDGRFGLHHLLMAVSFLANSGLAETGRVNVPDGYEDALFVMPWALQYDTEAKKGVA